MDIVNAGVVALYAEGYRTEQEQVIAVLRAAFAEMGLRSGDLEWLAEIASGRWPAEVRTKVRGWAAAVASVEDGEAR